MGTGGTAELRKTIPIIALALAGCIQSPESDFRQTVETAVKSDLRDPDSATFTEVRLYPIDNMAIGKVNARNGFGGMSGFQAFVYLDGNAALEGDTRFADYLNATTERNLKRADAINEKLSDDATPHEPS